MPRLSLHHVLDWRWISFHSFTGWMVILANVANSIAAAAWLVVVVRCPPPPSFPLGGVL